LCAKFLIFYTRQKGKVIHIVDKYVDNFLKLLKKVAIFCLLMCKNDRLINQASCNSTSFQNSTRILAASTFALTSTYMVLILYSLVMIAYTFVINLCMSTHHMFTRTSNFTMCVQKSNKIKAIFILKLFFTAYFILLYHNAPTLNHVTVLEIKNVKLHQQFINLLHQHTTAHQLNMLAIADRCQFSSHRTVSSQRIEPDLAIKVQLFTLVKTVA
jgi:hypothetical protein